MTMRRISLLIAALALATASPLVAATLTIDERDAPNGNFSNQFDRPTTVGSDVLRVVGGQNSSHDSDVLKFEGFASGAERLDFVITNPLGNWGAFNLRIKQEPFKGPDDWWPIAFSSSFDRVTDATPLAFSFDLGGHAGPLYLAFDFHDADFLSGDGLRYQITQEGSGLRTESRSESALAPVSAIPLPPAGALMLAGLGVLALLRRRRRA